MLLNTHPYYKELCHSEREQKRCYSEVQFGGLPMLTATFTSGR